MTISVKEYERLQKDVEKARSEADRAEGAVEQLLGRLKEEFDCSSVDEGDKLQRKLDEEAEKAEEAFDDALAEFKEEWNEVMEVEE